MALIHHIQGSFNSGELSPYLLGRVDIPKYAAGAKQILNWIVRPDGSLVRRPGTRFVREEMDSAVKGRVIPFVYSTEQAYIIELGDQVARFYKDEAIILSGGTPYEIALPYLEAEIYDLHFTQSANELYFAHENHHPRTLTRTGHTSWTSALLDLQDGPYLKARMLTPTEKVAGFGNLLPSTTSGTNKSVATSADPGFTTARDVGRVLRMLDPVSKTDWGSCRIVSVDSNVEIHVDWLEDYQGPIADTWCNSWRLGAWYTGNYPRTTDFHQQRLGFASTPAEPERIDLSETDDYVRFAPSDLDSTVTDANGLTYKIAGARDVQAIQWIFPVRHMLVGTTNGLWPVLAASVDEAVTPTNIHIARSARVGASRAQPVGSATGVIYASHSRKKLMYAAYDIALEGYAPEDLTLLASHITGTGITDIAHALEPFGVVWTVRDDGALPALTLERQQEVWGWHRHVLGGSFGAGAAVVESIATIPSPNWDHDQLWLTVKRTINGATVRYVGFLEEEFGDERDIESAFFVDCGLSHDNPITITGATQADPVVVTAPAHGLADGNSVRITHVAGMTQLNGKSYTVANKTTDTLELSGVDGTGYSEYVSGGEVRLKVSVISGLGHLEGETVAVLGDGAVQPSKVVSSGQITLGSPASEVHVGLGYLSDFETLPLGLQDEKGTMQGRKKKPTHADLRLHRTLGLQVGDSASDLEAIPFRTPEDPMDAPPPPFTGLYTQTLHHGHDEDAILYFRKDDPLPAAIISVTPTVGVSKR